LGSDFDRRERVEFRAVDLVSLDLVRAEVDGEEEVSSRVDVAGNCRKVEEKRKRVSIISKG
jgi:hypothetical protein